jgi:tetratricopeptide repeat protein 30
MTQSDILYNLALCHYKLQQLAMVLRHLAEVVQRGVQEHPELGVGR